MMADGVSCLVVESIDLPGSTNIGGYNQAGKLFVTYLCVENVIAHEVGHLMGIEGDYTLSSPGYDSLRIMNKTCSGDEDRMIESERVDYLTPG